MPREPKKRNSGASERRGEGIEHFNAGRFPQALASFRDARAAGDRSPELRSFVIHALNSSGRRPEAVAEYASLLKDFPRRLSLQAGLAPLLLHPDSLPQAEKSLRGVLAADPRNAGAARGLGEVLRVRAQAALYAGDLKTADELAREALARKRLEPETRRKLADVLRSCAFAHQLAGRNAAAAAAFRGLLKEEPRDARAWLGLAAVARKRPLLAKALRHDRGELTRAERFQALMRLGLHRKAVVEAEAILDAGPTVEDLRIFWDPWVWADRRPTAVRLKELRRLERELGGRRPETPWLHYYRAELLGPDEGMAHYEPIAAYPRARYGWMFAKAGLGALCAARYERAVSLFRVALRSEPVDWRTHAYLAEAHLCLRRPKDAYAEMNTAMSAAPPADAGQALAWRGLFDLWLGRYDSALERFDEALRLGAPYALAWRAGALLKLGRAPEALEQLDRALALFPRDPEAYVWRGETKRELGLYAEALEDLAAEPLADPESKPPIWLWALVNRALAKKALGDAAGFEADFRAVPAGLLDYLRAKTGLEDAEGLLRAGLELSRGFRRQEYQQAIWMI